MTTYVGRRDGADTTWEVTPEGLVFPDRVLAWHVVDSWSHAATRVRLELGEPGLDGADRMELSHLGSAKDAFVDQMRHARFLARRSALAQPPQGVVAQFHARVGDTTTAVMVMPYGLVTESDGSPAEFIPWGQVDDVQRDGHRFTITLRAADPCRIAGLGAMTDEFEIQVARARGESASRVRQVASSFGLGDLPWQNGWARGESDAIETWLRRAPVEEATLLRSVCTDLRAGLYLEGDQQVSFVLGRSSRDSVIVEGVGEEHRATYVFDTPDLDRVNAALLACSLRREVLYWPLDTLGATRALLRVSAPTQWLRSRLIDRVVHDRAWAENIRSTCR